MNVRTRFILILLAVLVINGAVFLAMWRQQPESAGGASTSEPSPLPAADAAPSPLTQQDTVPVYLRVKERRTDMAIPLFEWGLGPDTGHSAPPETWQPAEAQEGVAELAIPKDRLDERIWLRAPGYVIRSSHIPVPGDHSRRREASVYLTPESGLAPAAGDETTDVAMNDTAPAGATVKGVVTIGGEPPSSARVYLDIVDPQGRSHTLTPSAYKNGAFEIADVPLGEGTLSVEAAAGPAQWRSLNESLSIQSRRTYDVNINFPPAGSVAGFVVGVPDEGVGGVLVCEGELDTTGLGVEGVYALGGIAVGETRPDETGAFRVTGLDPGRYTVIGLAEFHYTDDEGEPQTAFWYDTKVVNVAAGQETTLTLNVE